MNKKRLIGLICAFFATMCWASNYPLSRLIFKNCGAVDLDPWWSVWLRTAMGALVMLPFTFVVKEGSWGKFKTNWKKDWKIFLYLGLFLTLEAAFSFAAGKYTTAARSSLFCNTSPVFTLLISFLCAKELLNGRKIMGVLMGLAGIIIAALSKGGDAFSAVGFSTLAGDMLALLSGVFWALFTVFGGDASSKYHGAFCAAVYRFYGIVLMVPVLFFCNITFDLPLMVWVGLLFMAGVSGGLAVWLWSIAQKHVEPSILGSFGYLSATGATLFSAIFLKEKITFPFIFAFILVLGAMALILKNDRKKESCSQ